MGSVVKLVIWCLVVGAVLAFLGLGPSDIWVWTWHQFETVFYNLRAVLGTVGTYLVLGAGVVLPIYGIYLLVRVLQRR